MGGLERAPGHHGDVRSSGRALRLILPDPIGFDLWLDLDHIGEAIAIAGACLDQVVRRVPAFATRDEVVEEEGERLPCDLFHLVGVVANLDKGALQR